MVVGSWIPFSSKSGLKLSNNFAADLTAVFLNRSHGYKFYYSYPGCLMLWSSTSKNHCNLHLEPEAKPYTKHRTAVWLQERCFDVKPMHFESIHLMPESRTVNIAMYSPCLAVSSELVILPWRRLCVTQTLPAKIANVLSALGLHLKGRVIMEAHTVVQTWISTAMVCRSCCNCSLNLNRYLLCASAPDGIGLAQPVLHWVKWSLFCWCW